MPFPQRTTITIPPTLGHVAIYKSKLFPRIKLPYRTFVANRACVLMEIAIRHKGIFPSPPTRPVMENRYFLRCAGQNIEERTPPIPNPKSQNSIDTPYCSITSGHQTLVFNCTREFREKFGTMYIVRNQSGLNGVKGSKLFQPNRAAQPVSACVAVEASPLPLSSHPLTLEPGEASRRFQNSVVMILILFGTN